MDSFSGPLAPHPVVRCVAGLGAALDDVAGVGPVGMTVPEEEAALVDLSRQIERAVGLKLAMMAAADDVAAEREKLDRELAKARRTTRLSLKNRGDGTTDLFAELPDAVAARLKTYLDVHSSPKHDAATPGDAYLDPATGQRLPAERVRGIAFAAMLERIDPQQMPLHGGTPTTLNVTVSLDTLRSGLGVGTLDDGTHIPAGEVRRLACNAGIIPVVLGGKSEVLDLGRVRRFYTGAQKRAMAIHKRR